MEIEPTKDAFDQIPMSDGLAPDCFRFKVKEGCESQYKCIKALLNRADVEEVIHAGYSGSNSEIVIRTILHMAGCKKPVKRMVMDFMVTSEDILNGLQHLKVLSMTDADAREGYCNMYKNFLSGNTHPLAGYTPDDQQLI